MQNLGYILVGVLVGLFGVFVSVIRSLSAEKKKVKKLEKTVEERKGEMEKIATVQKKVEEIKSEKKPEAKAAPPSGDSSSRLERLNRLHDN